MFRTSKKGFSSLELLVTLALVGLLLLIAVPAFSNILRRSRLDGAARQIVSDVRDARSQAIATGWDYRVVGFRFTSGNARRNQYRVVGRRSSAIAWPADTSPKFQSATQLAREWVDVATLYPGVRLVSPAGRFEVTFDSRGTAETSEFNPLLARHPGLQQKSITVSVVGSVRVQ